VSTFRYEVVQLRSLTHDCSANPQIKDPALR